MATRSNKTRDHGKKEKTNHEHRKDHDGEVCKQEGGDHS